MVGSCLQRRPLGCRALTIVLPAAFWPFLRLLMPHSVAATSGGVALTLVVLGSILAFYQRQRRRGKATVKVVLQPGQETSSPAKVILRVSAKQVFDVQWCFNGRELVVSRFKEPAGNSVDGRFIRPAVDLEGDSFELCDSTVRAGHFALRHIDSNSVTKNQLTTYGHVRAIAMDALLYIGDGEYGTLILLKEERQYGSSMAFNIMMMDPPVGIIEGLARAAGAALESSSPACSSRCRAEAVLPGQAPGAPRMTSQSTYDVSMLRASSDDRPRMPDRVRFKGEVSRKLIKDMTMLPEDKKSDLWWGAADFAEFLQVRVEIGKAYRAAARKLGVDVLDVSSVGSKGAEAYQHMCELAPCLKDESRRGLGLGRKKERARSRDAYIAAVLEEQERQRQAAIESDDSESSGLPRQRVAEAIARAARLVSEKDREYAHHLAQTYYEQDRLDWWQPSAEKQDSETFSATESPSCRAKRSRSESSVGSCDCTHDGAENSEEILQVIEEREEEAEEAVRARLNAKGFGLSRDKLQEVGLSATGHALSRHQRLRTVPGSFDDGMSSAGESDLEL